MPGGTLDRIASRSLAFCITVTKLSLRSMRRSPLDVAATADSPAIVKRAGRAAPRDLDDALFVGACW